MYILLIILILILFYNHKGVPIFLYHQVNPKSNVDPLTFEEHLKIISNKKMNTITLEEYGQGNIPKNSMLITLDDGYYDNYLYVYPLLKKYNMKATIFLNTLYLKESRDEIEDIETNNTANYRAMEKFKKTGCGKSNQYMSWEEIKEMHESGLVDFQCHSHKHVAIIKEFKIEGFYKGDEKDPTDMYLYGKISEGYPIFPKRGEYSGPGIIMDIRFLDVFKDFYLNTLKDKDKKNALKLANEFLEDNKEKYFKFENIEDFKIRITEDLNDNMEAIRSHLNKKAKYFCWPWGHRSKEAIKIMENLGIDGFITTKKGTNSYNPNWKMIRRIELRKFSPEKFKTNLFIARNLILGKIYGWIS
ncbi:MAG: polysaccharide deacetylase family protein [Cetobacterium sp.]